MAENELSIGQKLYKLGICQGAYFSALNVPEATRSKWINNRIHELYRKKPIADACLFVVLSQDCDIAKKPDSDNMDPLVELAVLKKIPTRRFKPSLIYSVSFTKLQLELSKNYYEAKLSEIIWVEKSELIELAPNLDINNLPDPSKKAFVTWRSERYARNSFPDSLMEAFFPFLDTVESFLIKHIHFIYDFYLKSTSNSFDFFILVRENCPGIVVNELNDILDDFVESVEKNSTYTCTSQNYIELPGISFSKLSQYRVLNLEKISLKAEDDNYDEDDF